MECRRGISWAWGWHTDTRKLINCTWSSFGTLGILEYIWKKQEITHYQRIHMVSIPGSKGWVPNSFALRKMLFPTAAVNIVLLFWLNKPSCASSETHKNECVTLVWKLINAIRFQFTCVGPERRGWTSHTLSWRRFPQSKTFVTGIRREIICFQSTNPWLDTHYILNWVVNLILKPENTLFQKFGDQWPSQWSSLQCQQQPHREWTVGPSPSKKPELHS